MAKVYCLNCDTLISAKKVALGAPIKCHKCRTEMIIIDTDPLEVSLTFEDWDNSDWLEEESYNWG